MKTEIMLVTPEMAEEWLRVNDLNNRSVRQSHVEYLSNEMANGRWQLTHQGIAFSVNKKLLDGQHRLLAVIKSQTAVQMMVTWGVSEELFYNIDRGATRGLQDILHMKSQEVAVYNFMRTLTGETSKASASDIGIYRECFNGLYDAIIASCPTNKATLSNAPVKAAAIVKILLGEDKRKVLSLYRDIVLHDLSKLSGLGKAFIEWSIDNPTRSGNYARKSMGLIYYKAFLSLSKSREGSNSIYTNATVIANIKESSAAVIKDCILHKYILTQDTVTSPSVKSGYVNQASAEASLLKETVGRLQKENKQLVENAVHNFRELAKAD